MSNPQSPQKQTSNPNAISARQAVGYVVIAAFLIGGYFAWQSNSARDAAKAEAASMPSVIIQGRAKDALSFGPWAKDSVYIRSNMTLTGNPGSFVQDIRYTAFDASGVKLDEGPVEHASLRQGETARASILIQHEKETRRVVVDVE